LLPTAAFGGTDIDAAETRCKPLQIHARPAATLYAAGSRREHMIVANKRAVPIGILHRLQAMLAGIMMDTSIRMFFERYERVFNQSLGGDADVNDVTALYSAEFIAASPAGVATGKNDDRLKETMARGYERYRAMGTKRMRLRNLSTPIIASPMSPGRRRIPKRASPTPRFLLMFTTSCAIWIKSQRCSAGCRVMRTRF
jgi:hypothetical protein